MERRKSFASSTSCQTPCLGVRPMLAFRVVNCRLMLLRIGVLASLGAAPAEPGLQETPTAKPRAAAATATAPAIRVWAGMLDLLAIVGRRYLSFGEPVS